MVGSPIEVWYEKKPWAGFILFFSRQSYYSQDHGLILESAVSLYCVWQDLEKWSLFSDTSSKI